MNPISYGVESLFAKVETPLYPTEEEEKVLAALTNLFPGAEFSKIDEKTISGTADLLNLKKMFQRQRTRDTVRVHLLAMSSPQLSFFLSKQAAAAGYANLVEHSNPLGEIRVITDGEPTAAIFWLVGQETELEEEL